jgi:hypothetical protein
MVSPPESAKSRIKVHIDSSYRDLIERAKADLEEAMDLKYKKQIETTEAKTDETGRSTATKIQGKLTVCKNFGDPPLQTTNPRLSLLYNVFSIGKRGFQSLGKL